MSGAFVFIDPSQFPARVRTDLFDSLHRRVINHKFHYDSYKQASKWLALHETYSPARTDVTCATMYGDAFRSLEQYGLGERIEIVSLGCGGGQKEAQLLEIIQRKDRELTCVLSDVSLPLVLTARSTALHFISPLNCRTVVCDLASAHDLSCLLESPAITKRLLTAFGLIPNFDPHELLSRIAALLAPNDLLLVSANLAPGQDNEAGVLAVLNQYDNALTRDWLMTFLLDVGFDGQDGDLIFDVELDDRGLRRITAHFHLVQERTLRVLDQEFSFHKGELIRLFFSYRHTVPGLQSLFAQHGIKDLQHWTNLAGDEGVFLCQRQAA